MCIIRPLCSLVCSRVVDGQIDGDEAAAGKKIRRPKGTRRTYLRVEFGWCVRWLHPFCRLLVLFLSCHFRQRRTPSVHHGAPPWATLLMRPVYPIPTRWETPASIIAMPSLAMYYFYCCVVIRSVSSSGMYLYRRAEVLTCCRVYGSPPGGGWLPSKQIICASPAQAVRK